MARTPVTAQPATGLLWIEPVTAAHRDPRTPAVAEQGYGDARILVEEEQGTREWRLDCPGFCEAELPPGEYRVSVAFTTGPDMVISRVPVLPYRQSYLRVDASVPSDDGPVARIAATADGPGPRTFAAVLEPGDVPWPRVDACDAEPVVADSPFERRPLRWTPGQPISAVWGDLRHWWGHLGGRLTRPDGAPALGLPVHVELLDEPGGPSRAPIAPLPARTQGDGCWGRGGLWPGRYRVVVDEPPFTYSAEVTVRHGGELILDRRVVGIAAPSTERNPPRVSVDVAPPGPISQLDALQIGARASSPAAWIDVRGRAIWWYVPRTWQAMYPVDGVEIAWTHEESGRTYFATTDEEGEYRLRLPSGVYRVAADKSPFLSVAARVLVTAHGHAVLAGYRRLTDASGIWVPAVTFQSGLMPAIHFDLALPGEHAKAPPTTTMLTVRPDAGPPADVPAPLGTRLTRDAAQMSPWVSPVDQPGVRDTVQGLYQFTPGVVYTEHTDTPAQFSAGGQQRLANRMTIDIMSADLGVAVNVFGIGVPGSGGLPAYDVTGGLRTLLPLAAIGDVTILTTNVPSRVARTPGAQTEMVTRAGGDRLAGELFTHYTPTALSASDWFDNAAGRDRRRTWIASGVSFGGPAPTGRFFFAWDTLHTDRSVTMTARVPSEGLRAETSGVSRALLDAFPRPTGADLGNGMAELRQLIPVTSHASVWSLRLDGTPSPSRRLFLRASRGTSGGTSLTDFAQLPVVQYDLRAGTATTALTAGATFLGARSVRKLRFNVTLHDGNLVAGRAPFGSAARLPLADLLPSTEQGAFLRVNLPGMPMINGPVKASGQRQVQIADQWQWQRGAHGVHAGLEYRGVVAIARQPNRYTLFIDDFTEFVAGRSGSVAIDYGGESRARIDQFAAFIEDDVKVSPNLSLQYGIRYSVRPAPRATTERQPLVCEIEALPARCVPRGGPLWNTSWMDVAPRLAVAYKPGWPFGRAAVVHAGWSLIVDELTNPGASAIGRGFPYVARRAVRNPVFPIVLPERPATFAGSPLAEAYAFPRDLRSPRVQQWHVSIDHPLGRGQRASSGYVGSKARHLPYWFGYDALGGDGTHPVHAFNNDGSSSYHALYSELVFRPVGRRIQARLTHTWGHAIDIDSGESATPHRPPAIVPAATNRGTADVDRRHVLRGLVSFQFPAPSRAGLARMLLSDWSLDAAVRLQSGAPFTVQYGFDPRDPSIFYAVRPDLVEGVSVWVDDPSSPTGRRVNRDAFRLPTDAQGTYGRNTLRAPWLRQLDLSLRRAIRWPSARAVLEIQADAYNVLNILNAGPPQSDLTLTNPVFGVPAESLAYALGTGTLDGGGSTPLLQDGAARSVRLTIRLRWGR